MNCFELHHRKLVHPRELSAEAEAHLRECSACAAFAEKIDSLEERLESELRVPVPDGLADRVLLNIRLQEARGKTAFGSVLYGLRRIRGTLFRRGAASLRKPGRAQWQGPARYALAAALVLGLGVAVFHPFTSPGTDLTRAVIAHVVHEEPVGMAAHQSGDPAVLPQVLAASGIRLPSDVHVVRYLGRCSPPNRTGEHLVLQTRLGKVTLVLMPSQPLTSRVVSSDEDKVAVAAPAPVGSLAVVADSKRTAVQIADLLLSSRGRGVRAGAV